MAKSKQGSRLSRSLEQQSKKQLYIFFLSSLLLIIILIYIGPRILDLIGSTLIRSESEDINSNENSIEIVAPPYFTEIPKASTDGKISVTGNTASKNATVELFVNNRKVTSKKVSETNTFEFSNISVNEGQNTVKGRTVVNDRKSDFTKDYLVVYSKEPPKIEDVSPADSSEFKRGDQEIQIQGKTEPLNTVTVNDFKAIVDENGGFSYFLRLNEGENKIVIKAVNTGGKETTKELTVHYRP